MNLIRPLFKFGVCAALLSFLCACQQMSPTEYGVLFRKLPPQLGGGVSNNLVAPGQRIAVWPWDSIYRFDTAVQDVSWGVTNEGGDTQDRGGYLHTRALDGNEVALAVTVRYKVSTDSAKLINLVQRVATSDAEVRDMVEAVSRADIRTYMNQLRTSAFLDEHSRYEAVDRAKASIQARLEPWGIEIIRLNLDDFRFERLLKDGTIDASYQEKITEIQKLREDTEREKSRIETVKAKKQQEYNTALAIWNRSIAEADGYNKQAQIRGSAYFDAKSNEHQAVLAQGQAEVKGLTEQINALTGPGGAAILKLELTKQLLRTNPRFVLMDQGKGGEGLQVRRTDTNQLLDQLGLMEGLKEEKKEITPPVRAE